jgi:hypothetical protein
MGETDLDVEYAAFANQALASFGGWHHSSTSRVRPTTTSCVLAKGGFMHDAFVAGVAEMRTAGLSVVDISARALVPAPGEASVAFRSFIKVLHNNGLTLQSRAENMVVTRGLRVLVKGPTVNHGGTLCSSRDFVVVTPAFALVESACIRHVISEAEKLIPRANERPCLLTLLRGRGVGRSSGVSLEERVPRPTGSMVALRQSPTFEALFRLNPALDVAACALLVQTTAVLITGYEDGGAKFRDRTSRHEAARHSGEAVRTILSFPL